MTRTIGIAVLLVAAPCSAEHAGQWTGPAQIWGATCGYCHGQGVGPEIRGLGLDAEMIRKVAREGLPGMPNFHPSEISDTELASLARWIAAQRPPAKPH